MKLFIGMGSSEEIPQKYYDDCDKLLNVLLKDNDLIYGSYDKGIMGHAYEITLKNKNKVIGIARNRHEDQVNSLKLDEKVIVDNISQRTFELINRCDAIIILPGGIGTINELFLSIDMKRGKEIDKPIIIYNSNNYFDKLLDFLDLLYNDKFTSSTVKDCYVVTNNIDDVVKYINGKEANNE